MLSARRFPPPWTVEETAPCFIVRDAKQQVLAFVLLRGRARKADDGQAAHPQRGAADRGQYRQAIAAEVPAASRYWRRCAGLRLWSVGLPQRDGSAHPRNRRMPALARWLRTMKHGAVSSELCGKLGDEIDRRRGEPTF